MFSIHGELRVEKILMIEIGIIIRNRELIREIQLEVGFNAIYLI
ncbi:UNVERIFIED_ORG: hypothetical protein ABID75_005585 [Bacillus proteolyticus]|nr:hypothetical protein [Bacillus cereus]